MWDAIASGMKGVKVNPMVGILKNATPTAGSYIMPKANAVSKLIGSRSIPRPGGVPSMESMSAAPRPGSFLMASQTTGTVAPPARNRSPAAFAQTDLAPPSTKLGAMRDEIVKIGAGFTLSPEARADLPKKDFAVSSKKSNTGKEAYPIPDRRHAGIALGFAKMHKDTADYDAVRAKVKAKYPDLLESHDKKHAVEKAAGISDHGLELAGLGILAAPSVDELQSHIRARLAGDKSENAVEKRQLLPSAAKPASELAGLGTLAVPAYRAIKGMAHA